MGGGHSGGRIGGGGRGSSGGGSVIDRYDDLPVVGKQQKIQFGKGQPQTQTSGTIQGYMQSTAGGLAITLVHQAVAMLAPWALPILAAAQIIAQIYNYTKAGWEIYKDSQQGAEGLRRAMKRFFVIGASAIISSGEQRLMNGSSFKLKAEKPVRDVSLLMTGVNPVIASTITESEESIESSAISNINDYITNLIANQLFGPG